MESTENKIVFSRMSNKITGLIAISLLILVLLYEGFDHPEAFHGDTFKVCLMYVFFVCIPLYGLHSLYHLLFRMPNAIILNGATKRIEWTHPISFLAPAARHTRFAEWEGVQSFKSAAADNQAVALALRAPSGRILVLEKETVKVVVEPGFWPKAREITEPAGIRDLRLRVAALTGLKDYGYTMIQLDDPAYDKVRKHVLPP